MTDASKLLALEKIRTELKRALTQAYFVFTKFDKPDFKTLAEGQNWYDQHNYIAEKMVGSWVDNTMRILEEWDTKTDEEPEHNTDGKECWCNPKMEYIVESDSWLIIHNTLQKDESHKVIN